MKLQQISDTKFIPYPNFLKSGVKILLGANSKNSKKALKYIFLCNGRSSLGIKIKLQEKANT